MKTMLLLTLIVLAIAGCAESSGESFDSSVETAVAKTVVADTSIVETVGDRGSAVQQTPDTVGPAQTSIFCPDCQLVDVTGVIDGDTIDTSVGRVRLFGVDAPESGDACFTEATEFTRQLVGSQVRLEDGPRVEDSFGRRLAYVYDPVGNSIDVQLVAGGFATAWTRDGQHKELLIGLEESARGNNAGCLWLRGGIVAAPRLLPADTTPMTTPDEAQPDVPATVAAAFTATAESAPTPASTPSPPYVPQLSDYLIAVDYLAPRSKTARTSLISRFDAVSVMYWLYILLLTESPSPTGFIEFAPKVLTNLLFPLEELQMLAALAMEPTHPEFVDTIVWAPSDEEAFLICRICVEAISARPLSPHEKWLLPPEPMCPIAIAEYLAYGSESELGFLGFIGERFLLELFPESEPIEPTPTFVPLPTLVPSPPSAG